MIRRQRKDTLTFKANTAIVSAMLAFCAFAETTVFVSPGGDDSAAGSATAPLASPAEALKRIRALRRATPALAGERATIRFAKGFYPMRETLTLTSEDSRIRFTGDSAESVLSGGIKLPRFTARPDGLWSTPVPEGMAPDLLWINGEYAQRAKMPNEGFFYMKRHCYPEEHDPFGAFFAYPEDLKPLMGKTEAELTNVVLRAYQSFAIATSRPKKVREDGLYIGTPIEYFPFFLWKAYHARYVIENLREALDAPGEWFFDGKTRELLYQPRAEDRIETTVAEIPRMSKLVVIAGDGSKPVRDVGFDGVAFEVSAFGLPADRWTGIQAACRLDAAIEISDAEEIRFTNVRIARTGQHGIWFRNGCRDSGMVKCLVEKTGGGSVRIGGGDRKRPVPAFVTLDNCIFRAGGRVNPDACGVYISIASDCAVTHCEIYDHFYSGVSVGWSWGYAPTKSKRNLIGWNHIHHIGQNVFSDLGGIYTLGVSPGTRIVGNHVHDCTPYKYNIGAVAQGIYLDEGTSGIAIESNLVHDVTGVAMHLHYGQTNLVQNNIFAYAGQTLARRTRDEKHLSETFERNIFYAKEGSAAYTGQMSKPGAVKNIKARDNVYWSETGFGDTAFFEVDWNTWTNLGPDTGSVLADPMFVDPAARDFRLKPGSPALAKGFKPWNFADAGVYGDPSWRAKASERTWRDVAVREPAKYSIPKRNRFKTGFEDRTVRGFGSLADLRDPKKGRGFYYCERDPHSGTRCVEARDRKGSAYGFWPHSNLKIDAEKHAKISFALKTDRKTNLKFSLRQLRPDKFREYTEGPSITVKGPVLTAGGQTLTVPENAWWTVTLVVDLEKRTWSVKREAKGLAPQELKNLPFPAGDFKRLDWIGFMSLADEDASWYIDDIDFEGI